MQLEKLTAITTIIGLLLTAILIGSKAEATGYHSYQSVSKSAAVASAKSNSSSKSTSDNSVFIEGDEYKRPSANGASINTTTYSDCVTALNATIGARSLVFGAGGTAIDPNCQAINSGHYVQSLIDHGAKHGYLTDVDMIVLGRRLVNSALKLEGIRQAGE